MNYGFYTAASGAFTQMARMDVLSNNLANVDTVGFKSLGIGIRHREAVRQEDGLMYVDSNELLEKLGGGVMPTATQISTAQGTVRNTNNPLDVALQGEGYLSIRLEGSGQQTGLTRDGRMLIDQTGRLVQATTGRPILSDAGNPIQLEVDATAEIRDDGAIFQNNVQVARLGLLNVPDPETMENMGGSAFRPNSAQIEQASVAIPRVLSRSVEESVVNPMRTMMGVTDAGGSVRSNLRMVSTIGEVMGLAINRLGSVTG